MRTMSLKTKKKRNFRRVLGVSLGSLLLVVTILAYYSANWYVKIYGQIGFDAIIYTLLVDMAGVESSLILQYLCGAVLPTVVCSALLCLLLFATWRKRLMMTVCRLRLKLFPVKPAVALALTVALSAGFLYRAGETSQFWEYLESISQESTLYQDYYHDPATTEITFPEEKRNLIYIFLESVETTFFSREQGGIMEECLIPELYALAEENINFSSTEQVGGVRAGTGGNWTIGAMVSQTAGIPLKTPPTVADGNAYGGDGVFLPGATTMMDILHENGYYQTLMVGSDSAFGGRSTLFGTHGADRIYDLYTAREDGLIPSDYKVWWGYEDAYLFTYAQQELTKIAAREEPFAFYMLTVDTHSVGGYTCADCPTTFDNKYENVYACSSKKVTAFVEWIQEQDFYENTTVVLIGDHPTMDNTYIKSVKTEADQNYSRRMYNCFINSAVQPVNTKNRTAFTLDMFPTVLASIGCRIEGEKLGLGTNLFADVTTLSEEIGEQALNEALGKKTSFYANKFYYSKRE